MEAYLIVTVTDCVSQVEEKPVNIQALAYIF